MKEVQKPYLKIVLQMKIQPPLFNWCRSLLLVVRTIECFTLRRIIILHHKSYVTYFQFLPTMIHFHHSLWNMSLNEGVM
jgi:hypothetical protein